MGKATKPRKKRVRKVDVEKLDDKSIDNLQMEISKKITEITEEACEKANKLLNIYGFQAKMQIALEEKQEKS
jgi:hypothetical protein